MAMERFKKIPKQLKLLSNGYSESIAQYQEGVEKKAIHREEEFERLISSISNNKFDFGFTPEGELFTSFRDLDGMRFTKRKLSLIL